MFKKVFMQDNFLNKTDCKKLIDFYKSKPLPEVFYQTYPMPLENNKLIKKINKLSLSMYNCVIDWCQIVKWPSSHPGKKLHLDKVEGGTPPSLSSIIYLNDNYKGGNTCFEDGTTFAPVAGRIILFDGDYYKHGVSSVQGEDRYTIASWFKI